MQYTMGSTRCASFQAQNEDGNNRFEKLDIRANSHCALTGVITGEASQDPKESGKRVPFEFFDVGFISGENSTIKSAPKKGKYPSYPVCPI
jgi:hypothetical protein